MSVVVLEPDAAPLVIDVGPPLGVTVDVASRALVIDVGPPLAPADFTPAFPGLAFPGLTWPGLTLTPEED